MERQRINPDTLELDFMNSYADIYHTLSLYVDVLLIYIFLQKC